MAKRKSKTGGTRYRWEFERDGVRYTGTAASKREANADKKAKLAEVEGKPVSSSKAAKRPAAGGLTLAQACTLYWDDKGRHHRSAADIERRLGIVKRLIGADTLVEAIRFADVNKAVQARRDEPGRYGKVLTAGAVNRDVVDQLRPVVLHAGRVEELTLPTIDWGKLRLKEAEEIVTEFTEAELDRWADELATPVERAFLYMATTYGSRLGELFAPADAFRLDAPGGPEVQFGRYLGRAGAWRDSRKDGSLHTIPLRHIEVELLGPLIERAAAIGPKTPIWVEPGQGQAITYYAMAGRLRRAARRAGVDQARLLHGMRHHAATQIVRENDGSLLLAQKLLGHRQIKTTGRYAHVSGEQLRGAVDRAATRNRTQSPTKTPPNSPPRGPGR